MEPLLGGLPAAGFDIDVRQNQLADLVVRQQTRQLRRFGAAGVKTRDKRLQRQFLIARSLRDCFQQVGRGSLGITLRQCEPAGEKIADDAARHLTGGTIGGRLGRRASRQQRKREKGGSPSGADMLHPLTLTAVTRYVIRLPMISDEK
jgi:hypothetical protein